AFSVFLRVPAQARLPPRCFMLSYIAAVALLVAPAITAPSTTAVCVDLTWVRILLLFARAQSNIGVSARLSILEVKILAWLAPISPPHVQEIICVHWLAFEIPALEDGGYYSFNSSLPNACVCNSVMWNLVSACSLCQRGLSGGWKEWRLSCPDNMVNVGKYPIPLPAGVSVPSWAYYDFTVADTFNAEIALQQSGLESSAVSVATSTPAPAPNPTVTSSAATEANGITSTPNPIKNQSESSSNTGAIIGGVVGGVLGIGVIGLIALVVVRRRKPEELAAKYPQISHKSPMNAAFNEATPTAGHVPSYQLGAPSPQMSTVEHKQYIPSHASTPATPTTGHYVDSLPYIYQYQGTPGRQPYPRAPEL
ncbi:unnamed protein product, partial [Rhizoctonia solani]